MSITSSAFRTPGRCWGWCIKHNDNWLIKEIPNGLTMLRIFAPLAGYLSYRAYVEGRAFWPGFWMAVLGALMVTDWLDGRAARSLDVISTFGKLADPVMDKAIAFTMLVLFWIGLNAHHRHPSLGLAILTLSLISLRILLDTALLLIGGLGGLAQKLGWRLTGQEVELGANLWGKWKFTFDCAAITTGFLVLFWDPSRLSTAPLAFDLFLAPACLCGTMSLIRHLQDALRPKAP